MQTSSVLSEIARRVFLSADPSAPPAARQFVRSTLIEAGVTDLVDEAVLLTTELVTNGVVHAGTDLELELLADPSGVTITVIDTAPERLIVPAPHPEPTAVGGRGLQIVSRAASRWGTTYHADTKAVWFQLDRPGRRSAGVDAHTTAAAFAELLAASPDGRLADDAPGFGRALLQSLGNHVPLRSASIRVDRADGAGLRTLVQINPLLHPDEGQMLLPLALGRPWSGELEVSTADNAVSRTLATLVADRMSGYLEAHRLRQVDQARKAWLAYLADVDTMLGHSLDRALTAALIPRLVVPRIGQWCSLHLAGKDGALSLAATTHVDERRTHLLSAALESAAALRSLHRLPTTSGASPVVIDGWLEGYAIPLTARDQFVGVITAGGHDGRQSADDAATLEEIARRAALALDNARIYEERQRIAQVLQRSLLPPRLPVIAGIDLAAEYSPTDEQIDVGGDFYDAVPMMDGRWLLVVGDVSGKGVEAAVVTGLVRDVIRALVVDGRPIPHILSVLNRTLAARAGGLYCTLRARDPRTRPRRRTARRAVSGRPRPPGAHLARPGGELRGALGTVLGLLETVHCPATQIRLMADDALVLHTDGVTERRNGRELFGRTRLRETLAPFAGYPASVVATQLRNTAIGFSPTPPQDDIAILVIRNEPG